MTRKRIRAVGSIKDYTYLGCPLTSNQSAWCFRLCRPDTEGHGRCGRLAPHGMKSRIQQGIEDYQRRLQVERGEMLELCA